MQHPAVERGIRESPWPYAKGGGHLGVKWRNGAAWNKQELDRRIARGEFTAIEALNRMTPGAPNLDGVPNGPRRPTLAMKWGPGGLASVRQPQTVVDAHVDQLKTHLTMRFLESLASDASVDAALDRLDGGTRSRRWAAPPQRTGETAGKVVIEIDDDEEDEAQAIAPARAVRKEKRKKSDDEA